MNCAFRFSNTYLSRPIYGHILADILPVQECQRHPLQIFYRLCEFTLTQIMGSYDIIQIIIVATVMADEPFVQFVRRMMLQIVEITFRRITIQTVQTFEIVITVMAVPLIFPIRRDTTLTSIEAIRPLSGSYTIAVCLFPLRA